MEKVINLTLKYKNFYSSCHFKKVKNQSTNCKMCTIRIISTGFISQIFDEQHINKCHVTQKRNSQAFHRWGNTCGQ